MPNQLGVNDFAAIEAKWQRAWSDGSASAPTGNGPKYYVVPMFPYPSGKLHVGHVRAYGIGDVVARYKGRCGFAVLHVMGWDAFGLPAENEAVKRGVHPRESTRRNIEVMKEQLVRAGIGYDWSRELATCDEDFDRWNQWLFLQLYQHGLAYRATAPVNWCPSCGTSLADEQVVGGRCERCETPVVVRPLEQWFFRVTAYADRLADDLEKLSAWPRHVVTSQRNWIGRQAGPDGRVSFHIRDWLISRQRYWGSPIPIIHCPRCGPVPVPEDRLPVRLPETVDFRPGGTGRSPLARVPEFVRTPCPRCGGPAERETDTMDTFVSSSWYYLRYLSPGHAGGPVARAAADRWMPIDLYVGGPEHTTVHLIYTRFVMKVLRDLGHVGFDEPVARLFVQGMVTKNGRKMSKSRGNAVSLDELVERYGADTARVHVFSLAPLEQDVEWTGQGVDGAHRFLKRVYGLACEAGGDPPEPAVAAHPANPMAPADLARLTGETITRVTADIEGLRFNTAMSALMSFSRALARAPAGLPGRREAVEALVSLLAPFAPHLAEEAWQVLGHRPSVHTEPWPTPEARPMSGGGRPIVIAVQVDGRVRDRLAVQPGAPEGEAVAAALARPKVRAALAGRPVKLTVYVPGHLINLVRGGDDDDEGLR